MFHFLNPNYALFQCVLAVKLTLTHIRIKRMNICHYGTLKCKKLLFHKIAIFFQLLPKRLDWQGQEHERSFESLVRTESSTW